VLFPLHLTPFEFYYWSDDRPDYPTAFPVELSFSGQLDEQAFRAAVVAAQSRHPLLAALIDDSGPRPQWVSCGEQVPTVDWAVEGVPITHPDGAYINLRREVGLRVWVRTGGATSRARFEFHHACCDGLAAFQFLEDFLLSYVITLGSADENPPLAQLSAERLLDRGTLIVENSEKPSLAIALRDAWVTARVWTEILFQRSTVLAVPGASTNGALEERVLRVAPQPVPNSIESLDEILGFETRLLGSEETRQLRAVAALHRTTLNDVFVRDVLIVLRDWNHAHGGTSRGRLRVSVPINVRGRAEQDMPAANRIGFAFVVPESCDFSEESTLLAAVHQQMEQIREWKLALYFLGGLAFASSLKGVVPWALRRNRSFATTVLSNLSRVFVKTPLPRRNGQLVCGNVVLERVTGVPPIRPLTRAAIAVIEYAGETAVCLRCDPSLFRPGDRQALADAYAERLRETARRGA
jgi:hypothetical protein